MGGISLCNVYKQSNKSEEKKNVASLAKINIKKARFSASHLLVGNICKNPFNLSQNKNNPGHAFRFLPSGVMPSP